MWITLEIHFFQHMNLYKSSPLALILTIHSVLMIHFSFLTHIWFRETVVFYSICKAEDNMMEGGDEGQSRDIFSPAVLIYYACYCSAYFKGLLDIYIYKHKMVLSASSRLYFMVEVSMHVCEDHTPSGKCGDRIPCVRGKRKEWDREVMPIYRKGLWERNAKQFHKWGPSGLHHSSLLFIFVSKKLSSKEYQVSGIQNCNDILVISLFPWLVWITPGKWSWRETFS